MKYSEKDPPDGIDVACEVTKAVVTTGMSSKDREKADITIDIFGIIIRILFKIFGWLFVIASILVLFLLSYILN